MKLRNILSLVAAGTLVFSACNSQSKKTNENSMEIKNEKDSLSYSLGVNIGNNLKPQFEDINIDLMSQAIKEVYSNAELKITNEKAAEYINKYMQTAATRKAEENKKKGQDFLAENAKRKEVTTTESGLQYEVISKGDGATPTPTSNVTVHYHGTLINGEVFDSSIERGQPATFGVNQVIKGWTEALQLMQVGSKFKLYIPSDLAYGERGAGPKIGPGATLIFEVELLSIQ